MAQNFAALRCFFTAADFARRSAAVGDNPRRGLALSWPTGDGSGASSASSKSCGSGGCSVAALLAGAEEGESFVRTFAYTSVEPCR
jgi:hypothetical protein